MWFPIFDKVHNLQKKYQKSTNMRLTESKIHYRHSIIIIILNLLVYTEMIHEVLNSMLGYISLPDILQKIIQVSCT